MMKNNTIKYFIPGYLLILCFILPLNFYIIGGDMGIGMQGSFYRYQVTGYGSGIIPLNQDLGYIMTGIYDGKTAISIGIWTIASFFLAAATVVALMTNIEPHKKRAHIISIFMFFASVGFLVSIMMQYGALFNGPAGISIPLGVPILLLFSIYCYKMRDTFL
ncbi:MAG: hypothetical protein WCX22_02970 [Methanoregula sp.]